MTGPLGGVPPSELLMTVSRTDRNGFAVLAVQGEVDLSTGGRLAEVANDALHSTEGRPVILDLTEVEFLSSSGLGVLVALDDEARSLGTKLRIVVNGTRSVLHPIRTMGLDDVLTLFATLDEAVSG